MDFHCGLRGMLLATVLTTLFTAVSGKNAGATLPIFRVRQEHVNKDRAIELAKGLYNICDFDVKKVDSRIILSSDTHRVEVDTIHGGVWTADESRMWNETLRPRLPDDKQARNIADKLVKEHNLLPDCTAGPFRMDFAHHGATLLATEANKSRETHKLDTRVTYSMTVDLPGHPGIQVVGGGGHFSVVLGNEGRLIGFHGVWRETDFEPFYAHVIPQKKADATFRNLTKDMHAVDFTSSLAYFSAPAFTKQEFLYPVYVYRATAVVGGKQVPMRAITIPATDFGPHSHSSAPQPLTRTHTAYPSHSTNPSHHNRRTNYTEKTLECGTSWIGLSGGLEGSQDNAQGFVTGLAADGWQVNFNWGNLDAWESDWNRNDDRWVDAADFVFYTGHASGDGWMLADPNDKFLTYTEVSGPRDRWGRQDLEWAIIAACGPLQDNVISPGGGDVFRWRDSFDGLHMLLGYGAVTFDNTEEGATVVKYAKEGSTLMHAWFRTGLQVQGCGENGVLPPNGPDMWVGALWASSPGINPANDHLWGHGPVSADPVSPTRFSAMWSHC